MKSRIVTTEICAEQDIVFVRQRARELARLLGFDRQDQSRIATAVSEVARNCFQYAGGGTVEFSLITDKVSCLEIVLHDKGPGIGNLNEILDGRYVSKTGMGVGIIGAKRLVDRFDITSNPGKGTRVSLAKCIPTLAKRIEPRELRGIVDELSKSLPTDLLNEVQVQNAELSRALEALQEQQQQLETLNRELEETNRGVVALYGELEEKAESLKRADVTKTRFLSHITHEFRAPLGATMNLTEILLEGADGPLNEMQTKTISLIHKSSEGLMVLVNDLLDLARVEAGKITVRPVQFDLEDIFASLRGLLRPFVNRNPSVNLEFHIAGGGLSVFGDEGKVTQILRNLVSNAIKYTEAGKVDVTARAISDKAYELVVSDTGIGIAPEDRERIFEEFAQVESPLQNKHKGTGIGLALTKQLVRILQGSVRVESTVGKGSTFTVTLPRRYRLADSEPDGTLIYESEFAEAAVKTVRPRILLIDDEAGERYFLRSVLTSQFDCEVVEASGGLAGLEQAEVHRPQLIFLDLSMDDIDGYTVLSRLKMSESLKNIPVIIHSGKRLDAHDLERLDQATGFLSKTEDTEESLLHKIQATVNTLGLKPKNSALH